MRCALIIGFSLLSEGESSVKDESEDVFPCRFPVSRAIRETALAAGWTGQKRKFSSQREPGWPT